uniref:Uncharacterized protein n=1 Tax=Panagrolaimus sp. JU765 TaxID=591449 RepID=A0AC34PWP9_9BILA
MKACLILLFFLIIVEGALIPAKSENDLPEELLSHLRTRNGKFIIRNGAKFNLSFEKNQFSLKFRKEKCTEGIFWFYISKNGEHASSSISDRIYENATGDSELTVKSNGEIFLDGTKRMTDNPFKLQANGSLSLIEFEIRDSGCEVILSQGQIMVEKSKPKNVEVPASADSTTIIIIGSLIGAVVAAGIIGFLVYWFACREKKEDNIEDNLANYGKVSRKDKNKFSSKKSATSSKDQNQTNPTEDTAEQKKLKEKQAKFTEAAQKFKFDLIELGSVCDFIKKN